MRELTKETAVASPGRTTCRSHEHTNFGDNRNHNHSYLEEADMSS